MRVAIIDLGTNSVRFDVHEIGILGKTRLLHREKIMVRLGQEAFVSGHLERNAVKRTLYAFLKFKEMASKLHVGWVVALGTGALREVTNRESFIRRIRRRTGITLRVISGSEEARLIALGILANESLGKEKVALVDIGGGSTEISICQKKRVLISESFPLGVARLHQMFLKKSPPDPKGIKNLRTYVRKTLSNGIKKGHWQSCDEVIGSSGTAKTLTRILKMEKNLNDLKLDHLKKLTYEMSTMNINQLLNLAGMEANRVDMILAGALIFEECMKKLGAKKARVTEYSLRDGIIEEQRVLLLKSSARSRPKQIMTDLYRRAILFGANKYHLKRSVKLAETLFDRMRPLHRLDKKWCLYLTTATLFRDIGELVSPIRLEDHSFYIVKSSQLPKLQEWEIEFIARLCLHHQGTKLEDQELDFLTEKKQKVAFLKILSMLQIVDALDTGRETKVEIKRVRPTGKFVELVFSGDRLTGLESVNIQKREQFFKKVFKRALIPKQL
jgi:exopolyphosphatase / guanosine-5'-triphosphate,3'-diphosphate pyrophosphatase